MKTKVFPKFLKFFLGGLVIFSFLAGGFLGSKPDNKEKMVANICGDRITEKELSLRSRESQSSSKEYEGKSSSEDLKDARGAALNKIFLERLTVKLPQFLGVKIDDRAILSDIKKLSIFQDSQNAFDSKKLVEFLQKIGKTEEEFKILVKADMFSKNLFQVLLNSKGTLDIKNNLSSEILSSKTVVDILFLEKILDNSWIPNDLDIERKYSESKEDFWVPEVRTINYVILKPEEFLSSDQLKKYIDEETIKKDADSKYAEIGGTNRRTFSLIECANKDELLKIKDYFISPVDKKLVDLKSAKELLSLVPSIIKKEQISCSYNRFLAQSDKEFLDEYNDDNISKSYSKIFDRSQIKDENYLVEDENPKGSFIAIIEKIHSSTKESILEEIKEQAIIDAQGKKFYELQDELEKESNNSINLSDFLVKFGYLEPKLVSAPISQENIPIELSSIKSYNPEFIDGVFSSKLDDKKILEGSEGEKIIFTVKNISTPFRMSLSEVKDKIIGQIKNEKTQEDFQKNLFMISESAKETKAFSENLNNLNGVKIFLDQEIETFAKDDEFDNQDASNNERLKIPDIIKKAIGFVPKLGDMVGPIETERGAYFVKVKAFRKLDLSEEEILELEKFSNQISYSAEIGEIWHQIMKYVSSQCKVTIYDEDLKGISLK